MKITKEDIIMQINTTNLEVISIDEICEILSCSRNTAYSLLSEEPQDDKITAWKVGNRWKCSRAALNEYIIRQSHISCKN